MAPSSEANAATRPYLRIFCICGQKMRVSEKMFGMPGKCIACRQKIRIPRRDELPPDIVEVYLRDHPEFLRQVQRAPLDPSDATPTGDDAEDVFQGTEQEQISTAPLDSLEVLQVLCSLDHLLTRRMPETGPERGDYQSQRQKVRLARSSVDEQLRQRLMEVAIELANTQEKIAQAGLAARLGEIEFAAYRETAERYRRTRDRLERRQQNLRGWLSVTDPYQAGGLVDVHADSVPEPHVQLAIPTDDEPTQPLLHVHVECLRDALFERAHCERKLREADRMAGTGPGTDAATIDLRAECKAQRQRAEARVGFCRDRLRQVIQDFRADLQVIQAQQELARGRLQIGDIARDRFDLLDRQLHQANGDISTGIAAAQRAVNANAAQDVPFPRGTFLGRLGIKTRDHGLALDSYVLWLAAALLAGSVFFPAWGERSFLASFWDPKLTGTLWQWSVLAPLAAAGVLIILSAVEVRRIRGGITLALWFFATCCTAYFLHELRFSLAPVAEALRDTGVPWWSEPAFIMISGASLFTVVAAGISLLPYQERWMPPAIAGLAAIVMLLAFTNLLGWRIPDPYVRVELPGATASTPQPVAITVGNRGGRELFLTASTTKLANGYLFAVEEQLGPTSWREVEVPVARQPDVPANSRVVRRVAAGGVERMTVLLAPGTYRAKLRNSDNEDIDVQTFRLEAAEPRQMPPPAVDPFETVGKEVVVPRRAEVELKLMIDGPDRAPRFSISLFPPGSAEIKRNLSLGDEVHDGWFLTEYNQKSQTVTLSDGSQFVILERGKRQLLPIAKPPVDATR